ncbi:hypothetical protein KAH55_03340, partial [bacterium]|nr:hypothetical protein [bacterium]
FLFFVGQVNAAHFTTDRGVRIRRDGQLLQCFVPDNQPFELHYSVQLGKLAKHGHQGYSCAEFVIFSGEHLFVIPASGVAQAIQVEFNFSLEKQAILPEPVSRLAAGKAAISCVDTTWRGVYALMKNHYAFGSFEVHQANKTTVFLPESESGNYSPLMDGFAALETYFSHFLPHESANFQLTLLPLTSAGNSFMGGVGPGSAGFSFSEHKKRDWQLLGHRLFHAYYDRAVNVRELHLPGNLWLLEGLATWSELAGTACLPQEVTSTWGGQENETIIDDLAVLYRRYLYFRFKDPELFSCAPNAEADIQQEGTREFLHYTQAPLIVAALEAKMSTGNSWGKWLRELPHQNPENIMPSILPFLPPESQPVAREWLDSPAPLNLFDYFSVYQEPVSGESKTNILAELQEFEYVLWTWFLAIPGTFLRHSLFPEPFEPAALAAQDNPVTFATPEIQQQLQKFSPTVFQALQIHFLRLRVCGISPTDPQRNRQLEQPKALAKWSDFLANVSNLG